MIPDIPFRVGGTGQAKGGSKHHVNDVKRGRETTANLLISPCRAANTNKKSYFGEWCMRTRTFASDAYFFRATGHKARVIMDTRWSPSLA